MKNKKVLVIILAIIIIIIFVTFLLRMGGGEQTDLSPSRGEDVTAEFIELWQGSPEAEVSQKIEAVKNLVTPDFVKSLDTKLAADTTSGVDPVTCLPVGNASFSLLVKESGSGDLSEPVSQEEMSIEVRERVNGAGDIFASTVFLVNSSGNWKIRKISCASSDDVDTLAE
jgi:hypothetical protein